MENLNQTLKRAKEGDHEAIAQLIDYYGAQQDEKNVAYWEARKSAESYAAFTIMSMLADGLTLLGAQAIGAWDEVENDCNSIQKKANELLEMYRSEEIYSNSKNIKTVKERLADAKYGLALAAYMRDDDASKAFQILYSQEPMPCKAAALLGCAAFETQRFDVAFKNLNKVICDREYALADRSNYRADEMMYAQAFLYMSILYRVGVPGIAAQDLERSFNILSTAVGIIKDADYRKRLVDELGRYRKKFFGGYKYV